jgi:alpha-glucosidase
LEVARFWLNRGVDGFRLDVANCYTHDRELRDNPPSGARNAVRPYFMQRHLYDRDRPETLDFAARLRALADERPGRFLLAELASDDPEGAIAEYTAGQNRFHTAYSFRFLSRPFGPEVIRKGVEDLFARAPDAWPSWAFSNHDFDRVASRWGEGRAPGFAKTLIMLLTSLPGTIFIYQGEELGLPQADVPFTALRDPDGLAFWPAYKGRDGERTPMPWTAAGVHAGFSDAEPWLPIDPRHLALAVDRQQADPRSTLAFTRDWLAFRSSRPAFAEAGIEFADDVPEGLLVFTRGAGALKLAFNLGSEPADLPVQGWRIVHSLDAAAYERGVRLGAGGAVALEPSDRPAI